jgi:putative toxin-antitoxin system antitoxin component (TIGR02293 family)
METTKSTTRIYRPGRSNHIPPEAAFAPRAVYTRLGLIHGDGSELIRALRDGVPVTVFDTLAAEIGTSKTLLGRVIGLPSSTLVRRRQSKRLSPEESDRLYRVASAYQRALQLFEGDRKAAQRWLNDPAKALGGISPIEYLDTEAGAEAIQDLILRLEHGIVT